MHKSARRGKLQRFMTDSRKDRSDAEPSEREPAKTENVTTPLGPLVGAAQASSAAPKPKAPRSPQDQPRALPASAEERTRELAARKRVAALVSGGLHFKIKRDGGRIQGQRGTGSAKLIARLTSKGFSPEVTLDLRGLPTVNARDAIASFVSVHHRRGVKQMSIAFDLPSGEADADTALDLIVAALTLGPAAALVRAFSSARESLGGNAALTVLLI
jgi:DNA-nicking Smr family endonuclease